MDHPLNYPMAAYAHDLAAEEAEATGECITMDDGPWGRLLSTVMFHYWGEILEVEEL